MKTKPVSLRLDAATIDYLDEHDSPSRNETLRRIIDRYRAICEEPVDLEELTEAQRFRIRSANLAPARSLRQYLDGELSAWPMLAGSIRQVPLSQLVAILDAVERLRSPRLSVPTQTPERHPGK